MVALAVALLVPVSQRFRPHLDALLGVGNPPGKVPAFVADGFDGRRYSPETLRGKVVLVNLWATWCPPCLMEMPALEAMHRRLENRGLVVLGLSTDRLPPEKVAAWVEARGYSYPMAMADSADQAALNASDRIPTSWLLDRSGRIRYQVIGPIGGMSLELAARRLLSEPAPR